MKTEQDVANTMHALGDKFCETLSEVGKDLEKEGFSDPQAMDIVISGHLGAILAFYAGSTNQGRGPILQVINEMFDDMGVQ